jgi:transposase-like protein
MAHPPEIKAAVMAALLAGQGVNEVAEKYDVPKQTVSDWAQNEIGQIRSKKGEVIAELTFGYLTAIISGLTKQAEIVSTPEYINKQSAADVAVLHGVMADKGFRLLSAVPTNARSGTDGNGNAGGEG